jgi:DNA-binding NtrC family response regulator
MSAVRVSANGVPVIVGVSKAIRDVLCLVDQVAATDCCVLIEGESGTGKELIARRLAAKSHRSEGPFIPVNCAGVSESLFESQFFGHVRGAFTGAEQNMLGVIRTAEGGTVFLDEICEIPLGLQPKLLRVLQEQEVMPVGKPVPIKVDTRFLAGTNRNLAEMVRQGAFRRDLYHRLNIVRVLLPALRDRAGDVPVLLRYFSELAAQRYQCSPIEVSAEIEAELIEYPWPGNIRELAAWVERLYVTGLSADILLEMLFAEGTQSQPAAPAAVAAAEASAAQGSCGEGVTLEAAERQAIVDAMQRSNCNQRQAARLLQVHRATLARKLKQYNLA